MPKFFSAYNTPELIATNPGDKYQIQYALTDEGLVETGKIDLDEYINSFAAECDINVILTKYLNGDISVLNKSAGTYADVSNIPTDVHQMYNIINYSEAVYANLTNDQKAAFNNDYETFLQAMQNIGEVGDQSSDKESAGSEQASGDGE